MSKAQILSQVRRNQPVHQELPALPDFPHGTQDEVAQFSAMVCAGGGKMIIGAVHESPESVLAQYFPHEKKIASTYAAYPGTLDVRTISNPLDLEGIDLAIILAQLGVAENGAVWVTETDCVHRVLPFIAQHLLVILDHRQIQPDMHAAYGAIQIDETGFGVFIAGPSKTADIEQSLVIGAQGARSFTVLLV